jgi:hypothetical protein
MWGKAIDPWSDMILMQVMIDNFSSGHVYIGNQNGHGELQPCPGTRID